jgi:3-hydroxyisobutyrate dehydrogenase-like beta-hydroxyacid dehydrogenase
MKVGVVGVGIMGSAIARNLRKSDAEVVGYDIAAARVAELKAMGAEVARSAGEVASKVDVVLTSLPSIAALDATVAAIAAAPKRGLVVCELSTLPIDVKMRARDALATVGVSLLDCPLSGTGAQAVTGDLAVFASGDKAAYERARDVFPRFARVTHYLGEFGNGSKMKFVANLLVAIHNVASAEAMVLARKAGLDPDLVAKVIPTGAGTSRVFELRAPLMVKGNYEPPAMKVEVWQKDMEIIGQYAESLGVATPTFSASAPVYDKAIERGLGGQDTAAVCTVLEEMSGVRRK